MSASMAEGIARLIAETLAYDETSMGNYVDSEYLEEAVIDGRFDLVALAEVLAANGYGKLEDAWDEGYGAGWNDCLLDLQNGGAKMTKNPYRRPE